MNALPMQMKTVMVAAMWQWPDASHLQPADVAPVPSAMAPSNGTPQRNVKFR